MNTINKRRIEVVIIIILVILIIGIIIAIAIGASKDTNNEVVCKCTCSVEKIEVVVKVEPIEPVETTEPTEATEETQTTEPTNLGEFMLTAYCACEKCCGKSDGITATGTTATQGRTIAVDPSVIQYGTEVIINNHTYIAEDCGGAIKGNRIDIYFDSHDEALEFGVQHADVYIVRS